jgi:hypothetical protein
MQCLICESAMRVAPLQHHGQAGWPDWPRDGTSRMTSSAPAVGTMMASLAEALALAQHAGLSQDELLEILSLGAMANPMFKLKARPVCP